ncbi:MAG: DUF748 domain-containing protein [Candidatus Omnitrophota bacterium]
MKKKVLLIIVLIIVIGIGLSIYLNKTLILNKIKTEVLQKIESQIGRTVSIGKIEYRVLKGFVISNLEISQSATGEQAHLIKIKQITFNPVLFPFILQKKIMIPSISVDSLNANVIRLDKNTWNFSDLIKPESATKKTESKFSVTVLRIIIRNSEISFQDETLDSTFSKKFKNLDLTLKPSLPKSIKFDLITNIDDSDSKISIDGKLDLPTKAVESSINISNLLITEYLAYFDKLPLTIKGGKLSAQLTGEFKNGRLDLRGTNSFENLDIQKDKTEIITDLATELSFAYDATNQDRPFDYEADVNLSNTKVLGLKYLEAIDNLSGKLNIVPDKISSGEISANLKGNLLKVSGTLKDFKDPYLDVNVSSDVSLATLKELFKDKVNLTKMEIDGDSQMQLALKGALSELNNLELQGKLRVSNAKINADYLPAEIDNIQTDIIFDKNTISWNNLTANLKGDKLSSSGSLKDFSNPQVSLNISSDSLNFETEFNIQNKLLKIAKLNGNFFSSRFDIKGAADISDASNPLVNIQTTIGIKLEDLADFNPKLKDMVNKIKLAGNLNARADLNGRLKDYQNWQLVLKGNCALFSIYGFKINDLALDYSQGNTPLANLRLTATPYSGKLLINSRIDFTDGDIPFISEIIINDVDLSKLKNDTELKNKDISGLLQSQTNLQGSGKNIKISLNGSGSLRIENGNLWELELLQGLGKLLLIPEFQKIVFREASGDFSIRDERIFTDNLILESDKMNILLEGNIDFSSNIDLTVTAQLSEGLIKDATDLQGMLSSILAQSTNAVIIKLTGTLKEPKHKIIPLPVKVFEKAKDFVIDDIIRDVLDIMK